MKKQIVKGIAMVMLVVGIAVTTAAVSNAQSAKKVVTDVPFDFIVGDKTLSSGEYTVRATTAPENGLIILDADGKSTGMRLTFPISPKNKRGARLVFHKYGQRYFLAEVWTGAGDVGRHLMKSRQERAIERELSSIASKSELSESMYQVVEVVAVHR